MTSAAAAALPAGDSVPTGHAGLRALLTNPEDVHAAAGALARGGVIGHGFANFYVLTTRPDRDTVRRVNLMKGRAPDQVGSITTTPARIRWSTTGPGSRPG